MQVTESDWRAKSLSIKSKGSQTPKATSLAGLHERRHISQGQYYTPTHISSGIWESLKQYRSLLKRDKINVLDPSVGNGSLLHSIKPEEASIYGADTDGRCIEALSEDADKAGFDYKFINTCVANLRAKEFHICVLNPAYSINISSPNLKDYPCTRYGKYGPSSSTTTNEYSLYLSLESADVVAAILPTAMDSICRSIKRLTHILVLPRNTFAKENATVTTAVYYFGPHKSTSVNKTRLQDDGWPTLNITPRSKYDYKSAVLNTLDIDYRTPSITTPCTGDNTVTLHHHRRRIVLGYKCGLTEAKVANALLKDIAVGDKLPKTIKYTGDSRLLLDVLLLQPDPETQLERLASHIDAYGGKAVISDTLRGYYKKLLKRHKRAITPMQHTIMSSQDASITVTAKKRMFLITGDYNSPSIAKGTVLTAHLDNDDYRIVHQDKTTTISHNELHDRFMVDNEAGESDWKQIHKGLVHHFPQIAKHYGAILDRLGIDFLAGFQRHDVLESLINPYGHLSALEQGSGKARMCVAITLAQPGRSLLLVEAGLMPEMVREINTVLNINSSLYQIIDKTFDRKLVDPKVKLYLTTYTTLRNGFIKRKGLARKLRRFFNTVICDEGGLLKNTQTQQSRAIMHLSPRKLIISDGTPISGYARNVLALSAISSGNGTAHQPYGLRGKPYIHTNLITTTSHAQRGEDVFFDKHVTVEWITHKFSQDLQSGGRREVPKIRSLNFFKTWLAPQVQRRTRTEPDLAIFNNCPAPIHEVQIVKWSKPHLAMYLKTSLEFINWWTNKKDDSSKLSMVAVLAKIAAVNRACNAPHTDSDALNYKTYTPVTTKQTAAIKYINSVVKDNDRKIIVYGQSPQLLQRLQTLTPHRSILFTGEDAIQKRTAELEQFKHGNINIVFSSWVMQRGVNIPQASDILFFQRNWSGATEAQAIARTQRPSQTKQVRVRYLHLEGSIDHYQAQAVSFKSRSAAAALDFKEEPDQDEEFLHIDRILDDFCQHTLGISAYEANKLLIA